jgi:alkylated DNA repair dioxygenase AlkB
MADDLELIRSLEQLGEHVADERFARDLYRALADRVWRRDGDEVSVSWKRAEEIVNQLRANLGEEPLTLAQTGGEGEVTDRVREAIEPLGWRTEPLDTSQSQPDHVDDPESPPPPDMGERQAPVEPPPAWRAAEEEAERHRP